MIDISVAESLTDADIESLASILIAVVEHGASVGWMQPPSHTEAASYWASVIRPGNKLLLAYEDQEIVGTAQLELAQKANGSHRAEVNKVLVDPRHQRKGIGAQLMRALEDVARREGRTLLHLDTNSDDIAINLYAKVGYTVAGTIPDWAGSPADGQLHGTTLFYKQLS